MWFELWLTLDSFPWHSCTVCCRFHQCPHKWGLLVSVLEVDFSVSGVCGWCSCQTLSLLPAGVWSCLLLSVCQMLMVVVCSQIAIQQWANVDKGHQHQQWFANVGQTLANLTITWNVGKWLGIQCCITILMPTLRQCWKSDHKLTFSENCWWTVGKGLTSQHHIANLMAMLGQCWNSDHLLLFLRNC